MPSAVFVVDRKLPRLVSAVVTLPSSVRAWPSSVSRLLISDVISSAVSKLDEPVSPNKASRAALASDTAVLLTPTSELAACSATLLESSNRDIKSPLPNEAAPSWSNVIVAVSLPPSPTFVKVTEVIASTALSKSAASTGFVESFANKPSPNASKEVKEVETVGSRTPV